MYLTDRLKNEEFANNWSEQARRSALGSESLKKLWSDSEFRLRHSKRASDNTKKRNSDPNSGLGFGNIWKNESSRSILEKRVGNKGKKGNHISEKTTSGEIYFASSWEERAYIILDLDPSVIYYSRGPRIEYINDSKKNSSYMVDISVSYSSNERRLIEVKGDHTKFTSRNKKKYRIACEFSKENGYLSFKVWDSKYLFPDKQINKLNKRVEYK
jgi:hypothetical protein